MLGTDPFWERVRIAYGFEIRRRTRNSSQLKFFEGENGRRRLYEPGEIAHVGGGINGAYIQFLETMGLPLSRTERLAKAHIHSSPPQTSGKGKFCVILERLDDTRYIVCYLATFGGSTFAPAIMSPVQKFFSVAAGEAPEWPKGFKPLRMTPPWVKTAYVLGIPVVRDDVEAIRGVSVRFMLQFGELPRFKHFVMKRLAEFKANSYQLRKNESRYQVKIHSITGGVGWSDDLEDKQSAVTIKKMDDEASDADPPTSIESPQGAPQASPTLGPLGATVSNLHPRAHLLEVPQRYNHLGWLIRYMHSDILHSATCLERAAKVSIPIVLRIFRRRTGAS